jgi:hypothetical protein
MRPLWHWELEKRGLSVTRQQGIPVVYEQVHIHTGFLRTSLLRTKS